MFCDWEKVCQQFRKFEYLGAKNRWSGIFGAAWRNRGATREVRGGPNLGVRNWKKIPSRCALPAEGAADRARAFRQARVCVAVIARGAAYAPEQGGGLATAKGKGQGKGESKSKGKHFQ